jgi:SAM-dependent methyltransferase
MTEARYTHGHHESVLRAHRWRTIENSCGYLIAHLRAGMSVLDVGCGPGTITADIAAHVAPGPVLGIDQAASVIEEAGLRQDRHNLRFTVGDVMSLDDGVQYDVVHAHQVLQHLQDPVGALRHMRTACREHGLVAVRDADYGTMTWYPNHRGLDHWLEVYRETARRNGAEPDAGRRLLSWAREARFDSVEASASTWCFADAEDRAWWGGLWAERVLESSFASHAVEFGLASVADLEQMARAWRWWSEQADGWFVVVHGEVLCRG